jgi:thiol-disulfide isomerase/thioredoxin
MSCRQSRLSNPIEAFISRITAAGPPVNRPPHIWLELDVRLVMALLLALALAGCDRQKAEVPQGEQPRAAAPAKRLPTGRLDRSHAGTPAPAILFENPDGEPATFAEFLGKPLLVNLWATWCAPCIVEMPSLDALAEREQGVTVLALSQDLAGQDKVEAFFAERDLAKLEAYIDPELAVMEKLRIDTLPTTILYDAHGREVWRMTGMEDWTADRAAKLLKEAEPG